MVMREHPAARQSESVNRLMRTHSEEVLLNHPEADHVPTLIKDKNKENDGKLGELPEFLVYVYKAKKYDLL